MKTIKFRHDLSESYATIEIMEDGKLIGTVQGEISRCFTGYDDVGRILTRLEANFNLDYDGLVPAPIKPEPTVSNDVLDRLITVLYWVSKRPAALHTSHGTNAFVAFNSPDEFRAWILGDPQ